MNVDKVLVIGAGYMGPIQARAWLDLGCAVTMADTEEISTVWTSEKGVLVPRKWNRRKIAEGMRSEFLLLTQDKRRSFELLKGVGAKIWNISAPTSLHLYYLKAAFRCGIERVLLEKPACIPNEYNEMEKIARCRANALVQVNYIERTNAAYLKVLQFLKEEKRRPIGGMFWRQHDVKTHVSSGKAPKDQAWSLFRDGAHDVSEIHGIFTILYENFMKHLIYESARFIPWRQKYPAERTLKLDADVNAEATLRCKETQIHIRIAKDEEEIKRFFILHGKEWLVFCSTLSRPEYGISPCAVIVRGQKYVERVIATAYSGGLPMENKLLGDIFREVEGQELVVGPIISQKLMCQNLLEANTTNGLICSIKSALEIEHMVKEIYKAGGITSFC